MTNPNDEAAATLPTISEMSGFSKKSATESSETLREYLEHLRDGRQPEATLSGRELVCLSGR